MDINMQSPMPAPEHDDEGKMAKADLYKTAKYSLKLFKMMEDNAQLEGWVQAKITKAADYLASVYHYLEYEMKFTEYGRAIEDSEMYTESEKRILKKKLFEAKEKVKDLKKAQAEKIKAKEKKKVKENANRFHPGHGISINGKEVDTDSLEIDGIDMKDYPDFVDAYFSYGEFMDGSEMNQDELDHLRDKEGGLLFDKIQDRLHESGMSEDGDERGGDDDTPSDFNKIRTSSGHTRHSRKASRAEKDHELHGDVPVTSLHPDHDERAAKFLAKQVRGNRVSPMDQLTKRKGMTDLDEAKSKKAKKDYDGDGKVETGKDEVIGSRRKAAGLPFKEGAKPDFLDMDKDGNKKEPMKKAVASKKVKEATDKKCNHTAKGKSCPVHGMKECSGMMEAKPSAGMSKGEKSAVAKKAQAGKDIGKPGKSFDKVAKAAGGGEKGTKIAAAAMWKNQAK